MDYHTELEIEKALVLTGTGEDKVTLYCTSISGNYEPPSEDSPHLELNFTTPKGKADEYLSKHFPGLPVETIEMRLFNPQFKRDSR